MGLLLYELLSVWLAGCLSLSDAYSKGNLRLTAARSSRQSFLSNLARGLSRLTPLKPMRAPPDILMGDIVVGVGGGLFQSL